MSMGVCGCGRAHVFRCCVNVRVRTSCGERHALGWGLGGHELVVLVVVVVAVVVVVVVMAPTCRCR